MTNSLTETETPGWIAEIKQADLTIWLTDEVPLMFREIVQRDEKQPSLFWMGSRGYYQDEEPRHLVQLKQPYFITSFPITQHQWRALIDQFADTELKVDPSHFKGKLHPVERVSWHDAVAWCELLQRCDPLLTLEDDFKTGLPTETQWEFACRAGTETEYYSGDGEAALAEVGWYNANAEGSTQPVGKLTPNDFGLHDIHGNVDEWCQDAWDVHAYKHSVDGVCDPEVTGDSDAVRVIRGGSWIFSPRFCRAGYRSRWSPGFRGRVLGFRVCLFPGPRNSQ